MQIFHDKVSINTYCKGETGRAGKTETSKRYAKGYRVKMLYEEVVLKLDYELELSGLGLAS